MTDVAPTSRVPKTRSTRAASPRRRPRRPKAPVVESARRARLFRELLAARGVTPGEVLSLDAAELFGCVPCLEGAAAELGWALERHAPTPAEQGIAEEIETLAWYFERDRAEADDEDEEEEDVEAARPGALGEAEARFRAPRRTGLVRFVRPEGDDLWLWTFTSHGDEEGWLSTPSRAALRPLLTTVRRLEREHRRKKGLVLVGNYGESTARPRPTTWDDLVLPAGLRDELRATVREFFASAELYREHRVAHRRGLLLAGPPGNGKTTILHAIASDLGLPVVVATLDDPSNVHNTRRAFRRAAQLAPAVLCFEDIDSLVGDGPGLAQFLNALDGLEPLEGVLIVATTNRPDRLDPAIARRPSRFDRVFLVPEPDLAQRRAYLARCLGDAEAELLDRFARATDGHSVAFLKELVLQARLGAIRRGERRPAAVDLEAALETTREHLRLASRGLEERGVGFGLTDDD